MNWAWGIYLSPTTKLTLMSLADNANDSAQCFPSVNYIATRCCISKRTVQRKLKVLEQKDLIRIHHQNRKDGSHRSNLYILNLSNTGSDKLTPPANAWKANTKLIKNGIECQETVSALTPHHDTYDTPLTIIESPKNTTTTTNTLVWSEKLTAAHHDSILSLSQNVEPVVVQLLLDELTGQIENIKNPVGYFRTLLQSYNSGEFIPAKALHVQSSRESRKRTELAVEEARKHGEERLERLVKQQRTETHG